MKLTNEGVKNLWERGGVAARYAKLERSRSYALGNDAKRFLVWLWTSCERLAPNEPAELFKWALEKLADVAGVNVLQPAAPTELKPPEMWKDIWGNPLPNPFSTGDLKGQSLVTQRDPMLAEWLRAFAESPYTAATSWADKQTAVLKQKAVEYNGDTHAINVFANGATETEKAQFIKNASPEVAERCRWEAKPVEFPNAGKHFDLTKQSKIASVPRLSALWDSMVESERSYVASEKAALQQQREQAAARLRELEAASGTTPQPERLVQRARVGRE